MKNVLFTWALLLMTTASGCTCYHAQKNSNNSRCTTGPECRQFAMRACNTYGITGEFSNSNDFPVSYRSSADFENRYQRSEWILQPRIAIPCASHVVLPQR